MPSQQRLRELLAYDAELGILTKKQCPLCGTKNVATHSYHNQGYLVLSFDKKSFLMHRLVWIYFHGSLPGDMEIDHIDGDRTNNKLENLRLVTRHENTVNKARRSDNTSGHTGVHWSNKESRWVAVIKVGGRAKYLGGFRDKQGAVAARKSAERIYGYHENNGREPVILAKDVHQRRTRWRKSSG